MPPPLRRRAALGAMAAGLLAGCGSVPTGPAVRAMAADEGLLAEALRLTDDLAALVAAAVVAHPALDDDLAGLRTAHRAHREALAQSGDDGARRAAPSVPGGRPAARAVVLRRERAAVIGYAELAGRAEGGRLARVLAAAAAGLAGRLTVLDPAGPPPSPGAGALPDGEVPEAALDALQTTLAAEHAAVWTLGLVGGRVPGFSAPDLLDEVDDAYDQHRGRRDALTAAVRGAGADPVAAAPAYEPPDLGGGLASLRNAAGDVEARCTATYAFLVASTVGERRTWATRTLADAAVRRVRLGGGPDDLPGV